MKEKFKHIFLALTIAENTCTGEPINELDEAIAILWVQHFRELTRAGKMITTIINHNKSLSYCNKIIILDE